MRASRPAPLALLALALLSLAPRMAQAQPAPAELEQQIRGWLVQLLGPNVALSDRPVRVTQDGDHYQAAVSLDGPIAGTRATLSGGDATATMHQLDGGRWAIDDIRLPSPLAARIAAPPGPAGAPFGWSLTLGDQQGRAVFDPGMATTTTLDVAWHDYATVTEQAPAIQTTHVDSYQSHTTLDPVGDGRLDAVTDSSWQSMHSVQELPSQDGKPPEKIDVTIARMQGTARASRISPDALSSLIRAAIDLAMIPQTSPADKPPAAAPAGPAPAPAARAGLHALIQALRGAMDGMEERLTADDIRIAAFGKTASAAHTAFGLTVGAPQGKADLRLTLAAEGIDASALPPGTARDLLPRRILLSPHVSGIPSADLFDLLDRAASGDTAGLAGQAMALLAKGPLQVGLDHVAMDVGAATLEADGAVSIATPAAVTGQAAIAVTGFDAFMQQAQTVPELGRVLPFLIFAKGIARQDGARMVWNVAYNGGHATVNGTDLSQLMPQGK